MKPRLLATLAAVVVVIVAACAPSTTRNVEPSRDAATFLALPKDMRRYFGSLADCEGVDRDRLLRNLADAAARRSYQADEFHGLLRSFHHLLTTEIRVPTSASDASDRPFPNNSDDVIYVWVDPTCDKCAVTVDLLRELQRDAMDAPSIVLRLFPSNTATAEYAAVGLELLRERDPDLFVPTLLEMLAVLPSNDAAIDRQLGPLLGLARLTDSPEFGRIQLAVRNMRDVANFGEYAPVVVYRRRFIRRDTTGSRAFNPLQDLATLKETMRFIRLEDASVTGERRCRQ